MSIKDIVIWLMILISGGSLIYIGNSEYDRVITAEGILIIVFGAIAWFVLT